MAKRIKFQPDLRGIAQILRSDDTHDFLADIAADVAGTADELAPYRLGYLAGSVDWEIEDQTRDDLGRFTPDGGLVGIVFADDFKAIFWEYGTANFPGGSPFLVPALEAQGLTVA